GDRIVHLAMRLQRQLQLHWREFGGDRLPLLLVGHHLRVPTRPVAHHSLLPFTELSQLCCRYRYSRADGNSGQPHLIEATNFCPNQGGPRSTRRLEGFVNLTEDWSMRLQDAGGSEPAAGTYVPPP